MRRWIAAFILVAVPLLNGCCCHRPWGGCGYGCGYRLFCRPCMFGPCADQCGGGCGYNSYGGCGGYGGCSSCYGGGAPFAGAPMPGAPVMGSPAPPSAGPMMGNPQIEKLSAAPTVSTRVMR